MKTKKTKKIKKIKFTTKIIITLIVALIALIAVLLLIFFISYNIHMNRMNEFAEETITKQEQKIKVPLPPAPEERYVSGIIQSIKEESFIVNLKNGKQEEIFFNAQTEILKGEGRGRIVSKEEIQPNYHVACFLPKDEDNNTALIVHITSKQK